MSLVSSIIFNVSAYMAIEDSNDMGKECHIGCRTNLSSKYGLTNFFLSIVNQWLDFFSLYAFPQLPFLSSFLPRTHLLWNPCETLNFYNDDNNFSHVDDIKSFKFDNTSGTSTTSYQCGWKPKRSWVFAAKEIGTKELLLRVETSQSSSSPLQHRSTSHWGFSMHKEKSS